MTTTRLLIATGKRVSILKNLGLSQLKACDLMIELVQLNIFVVSKILNTTKKAKQFFTLNKSKKVYFKL